MEEIRRAIDAVNGEILGLLKRRLELVEEIWELKRRREMELLDPAREEEMIDALLEQNRGALKPQAIRAIFAQIFRSTRPEA
ncbi:MAG: chorismate mutase [Planctomycetota bacterium]